MTLTFKRKCLEEDCKGIVDILYEEKYGRVQKYLSQFLELDLEKMYEVGKDEGYKIIYPILKKEYESSEVVIAEKLYEIKRYWRKEEEDILEILNSVFDYTIKDEKDIIAEFSINAVCPRYLEKWSFDVNYRKSIEEIILACIHEIIHFIWFEKWSEVFPDSNKNEYNAPNTPWLLSEIAIDAILKETRLEKYCVDDKPAYSYFYDIMIEDKNMMEYFRELFVSNNIQDFMIKGYKYVLKNREMIC